MTQKNVFLAFLSQESETIQITCSCKQQNTPIKKKKHKKRQTKKAAVMEQVLKVVHEIVASVKETFRNLSFCGSLGSRTECKSRK